MIIQDQENDERDIENNEEKKLETVLSKNEEEKTSSNNIKSSTVNSPSSIQINSSPSSWQTWKAVTLNESAPERSKCEDCIVVGKGR